MQAAKILALVLLLQGWLVRLEVPVAVTAVMRGGSNMSIQTTDPAVLKVWLNAVSVGCHVSRTNVSWQASCAVDIPECSWLPRRSLDRFGHTLATVAHAFLVIGADNYRPRPQSEHRRCHPKTVLCVLQPHCPHNCTQHDSLVADK